MNILAERMRELRGPSSQREMAEAIGIKYQAWDRYEKGKVTPGADVIQQICRVHACSADWLLGLTERGGSAGGGENAPSTKHQAPSTPHQPPTSPPPDCSRCKLMIAHIREITGRK